MKKQNEKVEDVQGTEQTKERNPSSSYTVKQMGENIKKLEKLKMCTQDELKQLKTLHKTIVQRWIGFQILIDENDEAKLNRE